MKQSLINAIGKKISSLNKEDVKGHLAWSEFEDFVKCFIKDWNKDIQKRKAAFAERIRAQQLDAKVKYTKELLNDFYLYWTEHGELDKKMRFEKERAFDIQRRLGTWFRNQKSAPGQSTSVNTETYSR